MAGTGSSFPTHPSAPVSIKIGFTETFLKKTWIYVNYSLDPLAAVLSLPDCSTLFGTWGSSVVVVGLAVIVPAATLALEPAVGAGAMKRNCFRGAEPL